MKRNVNQQQINTHRKFGAISNNFGHKARVSPKRKKYIQNTTSSDNFNHNRNPLRFSRSFPKNPVNIGLTTMQICMSNHIYSDNLCRKTIF